MATFPRIDSPCPLRFNSMPGAAGFDCSQCQRHVHNLSAMSESAREQFLAGCDDSVCVAYTVPRVSPRAATAWVLAASVGLMAGSAMAQSTPLPATLDEALAQMSGKSSGDTSTVQGQLGLDSVMMLGGVSNPRSAERVDFSVGPRAPELPVVLDDAYEPAVQASSIDAKGGSR
ncbi:hypothetical protein ELE36_11860 [Pseudolysobacter antarcticus]|uniref:Uncharacterized protein n=1 Tax=Pseudolysobacter antarcticus TaxID=2511995 RepID=A0A411HKS5_9GAMM|nr:hypothetical protein [Pseudolysobacter antarcticus]QBB70987.1 hypothetical protein ELE36_11860 [Pseudolysobacter antarcticus]